MISASLIHFAKSTFAARFLLNLLELSHTKFALSPMTWHVAAKNRSKTVQHCVTNSAGATKNLL